LFSCVDVKNNFKKKNIILIHFQIKITLNYNHYHTLKYFIDMKTSLKALKTFRIFNIIGYIDA